jgi:Uma2 family endonuclease
MKAGTRATIEDLYKVEGKAELVDGEIITMSPSGPMHGRAAARVFLSLLNYEAAVGWGHAVPDNVGFVVNLPHRKSFSPDAGYFVGEVGMGFVEGAPIFAVEVRSEDDYGPAAERRMAAKRADYFAAGTQVVWDVDLLGDDVVRVYRADNPGEPTVYRRGEEAEAEPALPGWRMQVDDLFR